MKKTLGLLIALFTIHGLNAQDCSVGLVTYCYENNEDTEIIYCPDNAATQVISVTMLDYDIESGYDLITIYDGSGTGGTVLAEFDGSGTSGYSYIATSVADGGDGCITVHVESDYGWSCDSGHFGNTEWEVACQTICNPPTAALTANQTEMCSTTALNQASPANVLFGAGGSTHADGSSFIQYDWDFGDGITTTTSTPNVAHTYSAGGGYIATLVVTDDLGCLSTELEEVFIKVSTTPNYMLSSDADPGGVCPGTTVNLSDSSTPYTWTETQNQPNPDPTPLPDGTGDSYTSSVTFNQFGSSDVIADGANMKVMLDMEHSYMGDLDIEIVCPDGTRVKILDFSSNSMGNCNVGGAGEYDGGEGDPGDGGEYWFEVGASTDFSSFSGPGSTSATGVDIPEGTYAPDESFADFDGCPINGIWTVEITDNYNLDDGTLFTWTIELGAIDQAKISLESFVTTIDDTSWDGENLTGTVATPTTPGTATYTLTTTDNFGCEHTGTTDVIVLPLSDPACTASGSNSISGKIFRDMDANGIYDGIDQGQAVIRLDLFDDVNTNQEYDDGTDVLIVSTVSEWDGDFTFSSIADGDYVIMPRVDDMPHTDLFGTPVPNYVLTTTTPAYTVVGSSAETGADIGYTGEAVACYALADAGDKDLYVVNRYSGYNNNVGEGPDDSDGMALHPDGSILIGHDGGDDWMMEIDLSDGSASAVSGSGYGEGDGDCGTTDLGEGDFEAMGADATTNVIYAIQEDSDCDEDILIAVDEQTGLAISTYVDGAGVTQDIFDDVDGDGNADDYVEFYGAETDNFRGLAVDPLDGTLYVLGVSNTLYTVEKTTGEVNKLGSMSGAVTGTCYSLAFATDGSMYTTTGGSSGREFYQINIREPEGAVPNYDFNTQLIGTFPASAADFEACDCVSGASADVCATMAATATSTNESCAENDGTLDVSVTGGVAPFTYTWSHGPTGESLTGLAAGDYEVTITSQVNACSITETFTVESDDCNDPPSADDESATLDEDANVDIDVLTGDTDADGTIDTSSLAIDSDPSNGNATINVDNTINYEPNPNYNGADSFTYEICDDDGECATATVSITVNPVNDAPTANDDSATVTQDTATPINVAANDHDALDPLGGLDLTSITITSGPSYGTLTNNNDGTITYDPDPGYLGSDSFDYEICDSGNPLPALCATATVTILVNTTECPDPDNDTEDPTIDCPGDQTLTGDSACQATIPDYTSLGTADDNCDSAPAIIQSPAAGTDITGTTTVTLTATDASGNSAECTFEVSIEDSTEPSITCPGDLTVDFTDDCDFTLGDYTASATVIDNCSGAVVTQSPAAGTVITSATTVTLTATDTAGNSSDCAFEVTPEDNEAPEINCAGDLTVSADENCEFTLLDYTGSATVSDNCTSSMTVSQSPEAGTIISSTTTITLSVTDDAGNSAECTFEITPEDDVAPTLTCPEDQTVALNEDCEVTLDDYTTLATVEDNCEGAVAITQSPAIGSIITSSTEVTLTATDEAGNSASCSFDVIAEDQTPPALTCPDDMIVSLNQDCEFVLDDYKAGATAEDNCGDVTLTQSPLAGTIINSATTVTILATDGSGNSTECSFTVTPVDDTAPSISCPDEQIIDVNDDCEYDLPDLTGLVAALDNCDSDLEITQSPAAGSLQSGTVSVTLTATDEAGNSASCTVDVIADDSTSPTIICPADIFLTSDPDSCDIAVSVDLPVVEDNCSGITVVNDYNGTSDASDVYPLGETIVTWTVTDGAGNQAECAMTVNISDGDAPTLECPADIAVEIAADETEAYVTVDPALASDACGEVTIENDVNGSEDASGDYPIGTTTVTWTATDEAGNQTSCTMEIVVTTENNGPEAADDELSLDEDESGTVDVLANDSEGQYEIDESTLVITDGPASGEAVINPDGTITYTPDDNFNGSDELTYEICDVEGGCSTATVSLTVNPINDEPVAQDDTVEVDEDSEVTIELLGNDSDPLDPSGEIDMTTIVIISQPEFGTVEVNDNGTVIYSPGPEFSGEDSFDYQVCDDGNPLPALCDEATVFITVNDVNDLPGLVDDTAETNEEAAVDIDILANDSDVDGEIDPTTVSIADEPNNGTVEVNDDGSVTYTPEPDFDGTDSFTYEVCDDQGGCDTADVTITVYPLNDEPNIADDEVDVMEDTPTVLDILINDDDDDDSLSIIDGSTVVILIEPNHGEATVNPDGSVTYVPEDNFNGEDSFTYQACDNGNPAPPQCGTALVTITVWPVNDAPEVNDDYDATASNTEVTTDVLFNDDDPLDPSGNIVPTTVTIVSDPASGSVEINPDGSITYTPDDSFQGEDSYVYEVCDDGNPLPAECGEATVYITVNDGVPTPGDDEYELYEDEEKVMDILSNDLDPQDDLDPTTCVITFEPSHGEIEINDDGTVTYTPEEHYYGEDIFSYEVCDLSGNCATANVVLTILPVNDAPQAIMDLMSVNEDMEATFEVLDNDSDEFDPEGGVDINTLTIVEEPENGEVTVNPDGTLTYIPDPDFEGEDIFTYEICDLGYPMPAECDTALVIITVVPGNDAPNAEDDTSNTTEEDTSIDISILDNDEDADGPIDIDSITISDDPDNGDVVINEDGTITYIPDPDFDGTDEFVYWVCDDADPPLCDSAIVVIDVTPVNDPPIVILANDEPNNDDEFWGPGLMTWEDVAFDVCYEIYDVDGPDVSINWEGTYSLNVGEPGTLVAMDAPNDTCFNYIPAPDYYGTDTLQILVCDGAGLCDTVITYIDIVPVNDGPDAIDDQDSTSDTIDITIDVIDNDIDPDGNTIEVTDVSGGEGTTVINPDGTITYIPVPGFCGYDTVQYVICDNGWPSLCDSALVIIAVLPGDQDGDGIPDAMEGFETLLDSDGDSIPDFIDTDSDNDGIPDSLEAAADYTDDLCNPTILDTDGDQVPDYLDEDSDGDTIPDEIEAGDDGNNPVDTDGDTMPDFQDPDSDNDTIPDEVEVDDGEVIDTDEDGTPDYLDEDADDDGIPDEVEAGDLPWEPVDTDGDGDPDFQDVDSDNDTISDEDEAGDDPENPVDTDGDGDPDFQDPDSDNDSIPDEVEADDGDPIDTDGDGVPDFQDEDSDDDGIPDEVEAGDDPWDPVDTDGDGDPDFQDPDSDNDEISDEDEAGDGDDPVDTDNDGIPDFQDEDSDNDGIPDGLDDGEEALDDCDDDLIPDYLDTDPCEDDGLLVPEGLSPNNDGFGDAWVIENIEMYPNAAVTIFNRWGTPVFSASPYLNDFAGEGNEPQAGILPTGTYYYLIDFGTEGMKPKQGFIYIAR